MYEFLLITCAASLGANFRFIIYKILEKKKFSKYFIIVLINTFSSFLLGLFISFQAQIASFTYSYKLGLFFSVGLLGSLSTFSTFIYDLFDLFLQFKLFKAFRLFIFSLVSGLIAITIGFFLGNQ